MNQSDPFAIPQLASKLFGDLPEWNLDDLYAGVDAPALKTDLTRAEADSVAFETTYKGKLAEIAAGADAGKTLATAVAAFGVLEELLGKIMSYAGLLHAGDTSDPDEADHEVREHGGFSFRRMRRTSVKGYSRLQSWVLRRST